MRRSATSNARVGFLMGVVALGWVALASPAAAASPNPTTGSLGVTVVDNSVDSSAYPTVTANLSIFDKATGRPETALDPGNVSLDPSGKIATFDSFTADNPAAYVLDIDTSGSMLDAGSMVRAKALAKAFVAHLGDNDYVRLLTFDVTTKASPNWLKGNDPSLARAIDKVDITKVKGKTQKTKLMEGIAQAGYWANTGLPKGVERREVVMITDASPEDNDLPGKPKDLNDALKSSPPTFVVGLLAPAKVGATLSGDLSLVGTDTGGLYKTADSADAATQAPTLFKEAWENTKSTWKVTFSTDPVPADSQVNEGLAIHDAQGATGTATVSYNSAGLFTKTQINADLANGATVTRDQTVNISAGGYTTWTGGYQIELFLDCDPQPQAAHCSRLESPEVSGGQSGSLAWSLSVASMAQGSHHAYARLAVTYNGKQYFYTKQRDFTRSGTTWNVAAIILTFGIAVPLVAAFFIASRRRGARPNRRKAQSAL